MEEQRIRRIVEMTLGPAPEREISRWKHIPECDFFGLWRIVLSARKFFESNKRLPYDHRASLYFKVLVAIELCESVRYAYSLRASEDVNELEVVSKYGHGGVRMIARWCETCHRYSMCAGTTVGPQPEYSKYVDESLLLTVRLSMIHEKWKEWRDLLFFDIAFSSSPLSGDLRHAIRRHLPGGKRFGRVTERLLCT
jgi:hypothetical protein